MNVATDRMSIYVSSQFIIIERGHNMEQSEDKLQLQIYFQLYQVSLLFVFGTALPQTRQAIVDWVHCGEKQPQVRAIGGPKESDATTAHQAGPFLTQQFDTALGKESEVLQDVFLSCLRQKWILVSLSDHI